MHEVQRKHFFEISRNSYRNASSLLVGTHKKIYHGTLPMYHGTFSYG